MCWLLLFVALCGKPPCLLFVTSNRLPDRGIGRGDREAPARCTRRHRRTLRCPGDEACHASLHARESFEERDQEAHREGSQSFVQRDLSGRRDGLESRREPALSSLGLQLLHPCYNPRVSIVVSATRRTDRLPPCPTITVLWRRPRCSRTETYQENLRYEISGHPRSAHPLTYAQ